MPVLANVKLGGFNRLVALDQHTLSDNIIVAYSAACASAGACIFAWIVKWWIFHKERSHGTVVLSRMEFCRVVREVIDSFAPENSQSLLAYSVANPVEAHVYGLGPLL